MYLYGIDFSSIIASQRGIDNLAISVFLSSIPVRK